jgi:hypothetical protein
MIMYLGDSGGVSPWFLGRDVLKEWHWTSCCESELVNATNDSDDRHGRVELLDVRHPWIEGIAGLGRLGGILAVVVRIFPW